MPKQRPKTSPVSPVPKEGNSLSDELRRMMAAEARPAQPDDEPQPSPQGEGSPLDDDEPVWRMGPLKSGGALSSAAQGNAATANEAGAESQVDRVLRIIPGTVVN